MILHHHSKQEEKKLSELSVIEEMTGLVDFFTTPIIMIIWDPPEYETWKKLIRREEEDHDRDAMRISIWFVFPRW